MLTPTEKEVYHKSIMLRALGAILDETFLSKILFFKGGSCAALLGWVDRFSVDLDFDLRRGIEKDEVRIRLKKSMQEIGLRLKQEASQELFYIFSYTPPFEGLRSNLKVSVVSNPPLANRYKVYYISLIQRYAICQTPETAFANKLVAIKERWGRYRSLAGRDLYDIHAFFVKGFKINADVIEERVKKSAEDYLVELGEFIEAKFSQKIIDEDLNLVLEKKRFVQIRRSLKQEVLMFLKERGKNRLVRSRR